MQFLHKHLRRLLLSSIKRYPNLAVDALRQGNLSFANLPPRPQRNFEDLDWLLSSNNTNRGLLLLQLDEAAFLFRLVRSKRAAQIAEIGRFYGGSTFLFAVASDDNSEVSSIDVTPQNDDSLQTALKKSGLAHKVTLIVGDSTVGEARPDFYDLVLVDGDHSYKGVKRDYEHWKRAVKAGGCLAFHNAAAARPFAHTKPGPLRIVEEIAMRDGAYFKREPNVGSLALFTRTANSWPIS